MPTHASLKLVDQTPHDAVTAERRSERRHPIEAQVTAIQSADPACQGQSCRIWSLKLKDISDGGLGAIAPAPIEVGSAISIFLPPHGPERGFDCSGRVVYCIRDQWGHQIGIKFDSRMAA